MVGAPNIEVRWDDTQSQWVFLIPSVSALSVQEMERVRKYVLEYWVPKALDMKEGDPEREVMLSRLRILRDSSAGALVQVLMGASFTERQILRPIGEKHPLQAPKRISPNVLKPRGESSG